MKKYLVLLCVFFASCSGSGDEKIKELPPRYSVMCNRSGDKFVAVMPGGTKLYKNEADNTPFDSYNGAVNRAWELYEFVPSKGDTVEWFECE